MIHKNKNSRGRKTGFTLVELLAVIAVLGLILIIAIPKVMDTLNTQKKRTLELTTRSIIKAAEEKYLENSAYGISEEITCEGVSNITSSDFKSCDIEFDDNGNASVTIIGKGRYEGITVCNGTKQTINVTLGEDSCVFRCQEGEKLVEIVNATKPYVIKSKNSCIAFATEIANEYNFSSEEKAIIEPVCNNQTINGLTFTDMATNMINNGLITEKELVERDVIEGKIEQTCEVSKGLNCTTDKELTPGVEFTHNQYTYRYKQEYMVGWKSMDQDGWGVILTDKASTAPVNTPVCSYINGKPLVSTSLMFIEFDTEGNPIESQTSEIDVSSWDTDNVTNMLAMFMGTIGVSEIKGLDKLETGNVTNMVGMFAVSGAITLDLSSFDTSNVIDMTEMFESSSATLLDLSGFDTSKVTSMSQMFMGSSATTIYVSDKWNMSNVETNDEMFMDATNLIGGNGTTYNSSYTDKTYARVDKEGEPGYFTYKASN